MKSKTKKVAVKKAAARKKVTPLTRIEVVDLISSVARVVATKFNVPARHLLREKFESALERDARTVFSHTVVNVLEIPASDKAEIMRCEVGKLGEVRRAKSFKHLNERMPEPVEAVRRELKEMGIKI
jgi:uncharacterized protein with GYD domain